MNETTTPARYLFAAGKIVPTQDGTQATSIEFLGRKPVEETIPAPDPNDPVDFEDVVSDHFAWCDECDSSKDAYWHEMDVREDPTTAFTDLSNIEPTC